MEDKRERWDYDGQGLGELNQDSCRRQGRRSLQVRRDLPMAAALGLRRGGCGPKKSGFLAESKLIRGLAKGGIGWAGGYLGLLIGVFHSWSNDGG